MKVLFVGDVIGNPGRRALARALPGLVERHRADWVIVNIENAAGGFGVTAQILAEFDNLPIDVYSSGNHIWDKKEVVQFLNDPKRKLIRPANYPDGNPGVGLHVGHTRAGVAVATINLQGRVFMDPIESPFAKADQILKGLKKSDLDEARVVIVDFHAEATSEKQALAFYLDGRVSAVLGTHTHVPTADERVLPGGTALLTDVGMTGPYESIIGFRPDKVLHRFLYSTPSSFEVGKGDLRLAGAVMDIDEGTGKTRSIERILEKVAGE
jgi:2',3'-cyclic-nucleotide 2'-phosphodiesterase